MSVRARFVLAALAISVVGGLSIRSTVAPVSAQQAAPAAATHVFEIRSYTASAGKLEALKARFRDHTIRIFDRHNMKSVAYWQAVEGPNSTTTLTYILMHDSREAAAKSWAAFNADPEWVKIRAASIVDGNPVAKVESYFATPSDFSPIK